MSKRLFLLILVALVFSMTSCQREQEWDGAPDIKAKVESEQKTRTSLSVDESGSGTIYWNPSDKIDVFFGSTKASYTSQNASDAITAVFKTSDSVSGADITSGNIWGLYPSNSSSSCDGNAITTTLPATQYGVPNTFDKNIFPAVAHSSSTNLQFYNVCGGIKFNLAFDDIKKITFRGNNNEDVAGEVSISFVDGVPKATVVNGAKEITLTPKTGATFTKGADYYITLLPGTFSDGFTMSFTTTDGSVAFFNYSEGEVTIRRSIFSRKSNLDVYASFGDERQPNNVIYYTSKDGTIITPYAPDVFGANIISNEYVGGRGVITFDGDVTSVGRRAFYIYCRGLTSIMLPSSIMSIGSQAFYGCLNLTAFNIPDSVERIEYEAFYQCSSLESIRIPNSVSYISISAFPNCSRLSSISVDSDNPVYDSRENCNAIIETKSSHLVLGCKNTIIPNSVNGIGANSFYGCSNLTEITIPNSIKTIGRYAFADCSSLTSIVIPFSVTSIEINPFIGCDHLESITVDSGNSVYDSRSNCNAIIETSSNVLVSGCQNTLIPDKVVSIQDFAFYGCSGLSFLSIPNTMTSIGDSAFHGCIGLTFLNIPKSVTSIGGAALYGTGLNSFDIPSSVTVISRFCFGWCSSLISVVIPDSITIIEDLSFYGCRELSTVSIPSNVTSIGSQAFQGCESMSSIRVRAVAPPSLGDDVFINTNNCPIYVPAKSVDAYKTADGWREYADRIQIEAVDLGLNVKWATCNVGADTPEGYGDYYAWGETESKSDYSGSTYKWCNGSNTTLTKYCYHSSFGNNGFTDDKTVLDLEDDAAHVNWGGRWRMPTHAEWTELRDNCTWTWTTQNGVNGYRVTSNKTGYTDKSIFLPAAGRRNDTNLNYVGTTGNYWSSSLSTDYPYDALSVYFNAGGIYGDYSDRYSGFSVRPVSE